MADLFPNQWYLCCISRQDKGSPKVMLLFQRDLIQLSPGHFWPVYPSIFDGSDMCESMRVMLLVHCTVVFSTDHTDLGSSILLQFQFAHYITFGSLFYVFFRNQSIPCVLFWRFNSRVSKCGVVFLWNIQHRDSAATFESGKKSHCLSFVMEIGIFVVTIS